MAVNISVVSSYSGKGVKTAISSLDDLGKAAARAGGGVGGHMQAIGGLVDGVGKKVAATGRSLTTHVTLPLVAVGAGLYSATQAASDLAETQSKVGVLFGKSAAEIEAFAATAAESMGQSKQEAMDAAGTFAIFGKSAGLAGSDLVDFSTGFVGVASDMASFANTSPEEAINAIGSALRGEMEPIRKYGVLLDDASLRQEALAQGLIKTTKESLTPQQKVLASQALIYKQLGKEGSNTIGDFARTSGGLANQQRIMRAELENTKTELGQEFLPIMLDMVKVFRDKVMPIIKSAIDRFKGLSPEAQKVGLIIAGIAAAVGPFMMVFGPLISTFGKGIAIVGRFATAIQAAGGFMPALSAGFAALTSPVVLVVAAIAGVVAILIATWRESEAFRDAVKSAFQAVKTAVVQAIETVRSALDRNRDGVDKLKAGFKTFGDFLAKYIVPFIKVYLVTAIKALAAIISFLIDWVFLAIDTFSKIANAIGTVIDWFKKLKAAISDALRGDFSGLLDIGKRIVEGIWNGITGAAGWLMDKIKGFAAGVVDGIKGFFGISSPAKVMIPIGEMIGAGVAKGIVNSSKTVTAGLKKLASIAQTAAQSALGKVKQKAIDALEFGKGIRESIVSFGSITQSSGSGSFPMDAGGYISGMSQRLAQVKEFGKNLEALRKLGLNNTSLQEIVAAGPIDGNQIAKALVAQGKSAISQVNSLQRQLGTAGRQIGSTATQSQFGMTTAQARGIVNTSVSVQKGAVVINYGAGVSASEKAQIRTLVETSVAAALTKAAKEASRKKK